MSQLTFQTTIHGIQFATYNEKPNAPLIHVEQIHSTDLALYPFEHLPKADGIIANLVDLEQHNFAIKTADCLPILLIGDEKFAFLHAGWRGLKDGILKNLLLQNISPKFAFIGPAISVDHFEVQDDFKQYFSETHFRAKHNKLYFDLVQETREQLSQLFPQIKTTLSQECTYSQTKYHSFRRDKTKHRNWHLISLKALT
jgi:YfiH family protein